MADEVNQPAPLPEGRFAGREMFAGLIRDALAHAARDGWRELILCDASFEDWPLQQREVVASLHAWAGAGRHCTLVAARYDIVTGHFARFVEWRRTWSHIVQCRVCRQVDGPDFPSILWSPHWVMRRLDPVRSAGVCGAEPERRVATREMLDELLQVSSPGFPATTLGL